MKRFTWEQRISRARELGEVYPFAAEVLAFYASVAGFQRDLYTSIRSAKRDTQLSGPSFRERLDAVLPLARFPAFLALIRQVAPEPLAGAAAQVAAAGPPGWDSLLHSETVWHGPLTREPASEARSIQAVDDHAAPPLSRAAFAGQGGDFPEEFLARAFLQPHAEFVVEQTPPPKPGGSPRSATCPACGAEPVVAVLREESLGARRSFVCSLCAYEWDFPRALCPACGEDRAEALSVYTAEQFEHVRVDACDTCKTYMKAVDLTRNGLAIPVVDELATLPLTLWAQENGYSKLQPNLIAV